MAILQWTDLALGVWLSFTVFAPLQVSVVELQRLDHKVGFLPFGDSLRDELGYPFITKSGLFPLVWLFLLHDCQYFTFGQFPLFTKLFQPNRLGY